MHHLCCPLKITKCTSACVNHSNRRTCLCFLSHWSLWRVWAWCPLLWAWCCSSVFLPERCSRVSRCIHKQARSCFWSFAAYSSTTAGYGRAVEGSYLHFGHLTALCYLFLGIHGCAGGGNGEIPAWSMPLTGSTLIHMRAVLVARSSRSDSGGSVAPVELTKLLLSPSKYQPSKVLSSQCNVCTSATFNMQTIQNYWTRQTYCEFKKWKKLRPAEQLQLSDRGVTGDKQDENTLQTWATVETRP